MVPDEYIDPLYKIIKALEKREGKSSEKDWLEFIDKTYGCMQDDPLDKKLTKKEKKLYLKEIKKDITYFNRSYTKAHITVDINGAGPDKSAQMIMREIEDKLII